MKRLKSVEGVILPQDSLMKKESVLIKSNHYEQTWFIFISGIMQQIIHKLYLYFRLFLKFSTLKDKINKRHKVNNLHSPRIDKMHHSLWHAIV